MTRQAFIECPHCGDTLIYRRSAAGNHYAHENDDAKYACEADYR